MYIQTSHSPIILSPGRADNGGSINSTKSLPSVPKYRIKEKKLDKEKTLRKQKKILLQIIYENK